MHTEPRFSEGQTTKCYKHFALERADDVLVVVLGQYFDSLGDSESLEERAILLEEIRDPALRAVVFDFAKVEYFDSPVLEILCQVWRKNEFLVGFSNRG
jgi:anti-anti-sigma regulatory factor